MKLESLKWVFSKTFSHRAMKFGTRKQVPTTNTTAKFQGHSSIITSFTPHMCDIQGNLSQNVNIAVYPFNPFGM